MPAKTYVQVDHIYTSEIQDFVYHPVGLQVLPATHKKEHNKNSSTIIALNAAFSEYLSLALNRSSCIWLPY